MRHSSRIAERLSLSLATFRASCAELLLRTRGNPERVFLILSTLYAFSIGLTMGTYVLFLRSLGLTPIEINLLNCTFFLGRFFLEVPTGVIADVFGRKVSTIVSYVLYVIGLILYWKATTFLGCLVAELVLAVGSTCISGAFDAWVNDEMKDRGATQADLRRLASRENMLDRIATVIAAPLGGIAAYALGAEVPWLLAGIGIAVILGLALLLMRETRVSQRQALPHREMIATARRSMRYAASPGPIRAFLLVSACFSFAVMAPNMQWAPFFEHSVGGALGAGFLFAGASLVVALGAWLSPRLAAWAGDEWKGLGIALTVAGIGIGCVPLLVFPLSLAPFALYEIGCGMFNPLKRASLNNAIDSDDRATILSCDEMFSKLGGGAGLLITGLLVQYVSPGSAWICGGVTCIIAAYVIWHTRFRRIRPASDPL